MVTKELVDYIKTERARGVTDEALRSVLRSGGEWSSVDIEEALKSTESLKVFRRQRRWIIFSVAAVPVFYFAITQSVSAGLWLMVPVGSILVAYCVSALVTFKLKRLGSRTKDIFLLIALIFLNLAVTGAAMFGFVLLMFELIM